MCKSPAWPLAWMCKSPAWPDLRSVRAWLARLEKDMDRETTRCIERYKMHICLGNLGVGGRESPRWWALINIRCIYAKAT